MDVAVRHRIRDDSISSEGLHLFSLRTKNRINKDEFRNNDAYVKKKMRMIKNHAKMLEPVFGWRRFCARIPARVDNAHHHAVVLRHIQNSVRG